eukprot:998779-Pyramimonas_sp.AAC.1
MRTFLYQGTLSSSDKLMPPLAADSFLVLCACTATMGCAHPSRNAPSLDARSLSVTRRSVT